MKILLILALLAAGLALGCRAAEDAVGEVQEESSAARATREAGYTPTPAPRAERLAELPTATPEPSPLADKKVITCVGPEPCIIPLATPTRGPGICYRTPAVQDWILSRLQRTTCAHTGIAELYRITYPVDFAGLKAGDLSGLVNVPSLTIGAHQCGDWADSEYAAGVLEGFNPEARIQIYDNVRSAYRYPEDWPQSVIFDAFLRAESVEEAQRTIGQSVHETEIDRLGDSRMDALKNRALALKDKINAHAVAVAEAIREAQGIDGSVHLEGFGLAVVGKDADDIRDSRVYVQVGFDNRDCEG